VFVRHHYPVESSDRLVIDVGENIGLFTAYAARQAASPQVVAIVLLLHRERALAFFNMAKNIRRSQK
jgi:hypothetical protein